MPWLCGGDWSSGKWIVGCSAYRGMDHIVLFFDVYHRVEHQDRDTAATTFVDIKIDKLIQINYEGK